MRKRCGGCSSPELADRLPTEHAAQLDFKIELRRGLEHGIGHLQAINGTAAQRLVTGRQPAAKINHGLEAGNDGPAGHQLVELHQRQCIVADAGCDGHAAAFGGLSPHPERDVGKLNEIVLGQRSLPLHTHAVYECAIRAAHVPQHEAGARFDNLGVHARHRAIRKAQADIGAATDAEGKGINRDVPNGLPFRRLPGQKP